MRRFCPCVLFFLLLGWCFAQESAQSSGKTPATGATGSASSGDNKSLIDENPVTVKTNGDSKKPADTDAVFGVPPLPPGKTSLVGGIVGNIDGVHNRLAVKVFKGGKWTVAFDERTHFYIDGAETTFENVKKGERVYVDTMLDNHRIFARNVHIVMKTGPASARGQVTENENGIISVRDELSDRAVQFRVNGETQVKRDGAAASVADIRPGSLITVQFSPNHDGEGGAAREITILAANGQSFTFAGKVRHLDLRNNQLAVENDSDNKTYEIALDSDKTLPPNLMVGSDVTVAAVFNGRQYVASNISVK